MLVLVVYDIANNRRRQKLSKLLEGYGRRVQESVFECFLSFDEMKRLHDLVQKRVKPTEDNVRLYWISSGALAKTLTIGSTAPQPPPNAYII
ncbi:MAG: CRISPR-associated endonuclease Cas2 [Elainellaceae cyanobacterium]